jgi:uncharacterized protein (DUF4415 family)
MPRTPRAERIDSDNPEATAEWFDRAKPAGEVLADLLGPEAAQEMLRPKRGRPALSQPKQHVNIRIDADVLGAFKDGGAGWQTRINQALRDWLSSHPEVQKN